jgi:hypothetical protein
MGRSPRRLGHTRGGVIGSVLDILRAQGGLASAVLPPALEELLGALDDQGGNPPVAKLTKTVPLFGMPVLALDVNQTVRFEVAVPGAGGEAFVVSLQENPADPGLLRFADRDVPFLRPAIVKNDGTPGGAEWLELNAAPAHEGVHLSGDVAVRVTAAPGGFAGLEFGPPAAGPQIVHLTADPPAILLGETGFGLDLSGVYLDDDANVAPPKPIDAENQPIPSPSDDDAWKGVALHARLFLPPTVPYFGRKPIAAAVALGRPAGAFGRVDVKLPKEEHRPGPITGTVEWNDPTAQGLFDLVPTAVELSFDWTTDGTKLPAGGHTLELAPGGVIRFTARFARSPGGGDALFQVTAAAAGGGSLLDVHAVPGDVAALATVGAAALPVAVVADDPTSTVEGGLVFQSLLGALAKGAAAVAFGHSGHVSVHRVSLEAAAAGQSAGRIRLRMDYSVSLQVDTVDLGGFTVGMDPNRPIRARFEGVVVEIDPNKPGADAFCVSFTEARPEIEDPGGWIFNGPGLQVVGTRAGRGSLWFDIDLVFALDLGPVKVEGATVRVVVGPGGSLSGEFRGMTVALDISEVISGRGTLHLLPGGFDARLDASILLLDLNVDGYLAKQDDLLLIQLESDLPGPVPLAATGLALFAVGGVFGINTRALPAPPGTDPIAYQLGWTPRLTPPPAKIAASPGGMLFGLNGTVGTAPDLGFTFKGNMGLVIGAPDFFLRFGLDGKLFAGVAQAQGVIASDADGLTVGVHGHASLGDSPLTLFEVEIPFGAYYPYGSDAWYVHLGTDKDPIRATVLPDLFSVGASAFVMIHGHDLQLNFAGRPPMSFGGFSVGFGFAFEEKLGGSVVYLELHASAVVGIGTNPLITRGHGNLGGSLHLGPVSVGADADVDFQVGPTDVLWAKFDVCGSVDLFFFSLSACITFSIGVLPAAEVPDPGKLLVDVNLSDHLYRLQGAAATGADPAPVVWPDVIPIVSFEVGPQPALAGGPFHDRLTSTNAGSGSTGTSELKYTWKLTTLDLVEITPGGDVPVAGQLDARWQIPRDGSSASNLTGTRELALLTWDSAVWSARLAHGGVGVPHDPVAAQASSCTVQVAAAPGWALGFGAAPDGASWILLPDPAGGPPNQSVVHATVTPMWDGFPLTDAVGASLRPPGRLLPWRSVPLEEPFEAPERTFDGELRVLAVNALQESGKATVYLERKQEIRIAVNGDWLADSRLWLRIGNPENLHGVTTPDPNDPGGQVDWEHKEPVQLPDGSYAIEYALTGLPDCDRLTIWATLTDQVGILGLAGVTVGAVSAAQAANDATAAQSATNTDLAQEPDPAHLRDLLEPATEYAIDIGVTADGSRVQPDGTVLARKTFDEQRVRYRFKTADEAALVVGGAGYLKTIYALWDRFDVSQLERYLGAYWPPDRVENWLCDDETQRADFLAGHVEALAEKYGRTLLLVSERTDVPPAVSGDGPLAAVWTALVAAGILPLSHQNLVVAVLAGDCPQPTHGASLRGKRALEPQAEYELFLSIPHQVAPSEHPDWHGAPRLPGVRFRTSRYRNATELLADLSFTAAGNESPDGDLEVEAGPVTGQGSQDSAFERALVDLGLATWSPPGSGRTSVLWTKDGLCRGLLLEAPEPIVRILPGGSPRIQLSAVKAGGHDFDLAASTAQRTRLLYLSAPFQPAGEALELTLHDFPTEAAPSVTTLRCRLGARPAWKDDA